MRIHKRVKNLTEPEKEQFERYLEQKLRKIKPLIETQYPDEDTTSLDAKIEKVKQFNRVVFKFNYTLDLPKTRPVAVRGAKHTVTECMDEATDRLEGGIRKCLSGLKDKKVRRKKRSATRL